MKKTTVTKRRACWEANEVFKWGAEPGVGGIMFNVEKPRRGDVVECPTCGKLVKLRNSVSSIHYGMIPFHYSAGE